MRWLAVCGSLLVMALAGCTVPVATPIEAAAELHRTNESGTEAAVSGWANFTQLEEKVTVVVTVKGLTAGRHGVHVHEVGDCGARPGNMTSPLSTPGGKAGGHYNPDSKAHGEHAGDLGNVAVDASGRGTATLESTRFSLDVKSARSVVGRSIIVHALEDDGTPTANFGARTLCGLIGLL